MPLYYFGLDDSLPPPEQVGEDFDSDKEAIERAAVIAAEYGKNKPRPPIIAVYKRIA